jgi:tRNA dimethylallyltransferase
MEAMTDTSFLDGLANTSDLDALLIAGPTASGKSAFALEAAKRTGGVIINADSMQIYDGLRILTARPTVEEESQVEHHLYGCVDPQTAFSTGDYTRTIAPLLKRFVLEKRLVIIVGGTGLYFNALTKGLVDIPDLDPHIMEDVEAMQARGEDLHAWLALHDPASAERLSPTDTPRLQRATAVKLATGRTLGAWQQETTAPLIPAGRWRGVFLAPSREMLYARINSRFVSMLDKGAMDEARAIMALDLPANRGVMKAHGMPHLLAYLRGETTLDDAVRLGQQDTRNYAKRQFTWARRFMADWQWIEPKN